ncbi:uncharacterized protein BN574_01751 [Phascolarctobacterium sp. CAG:266]|nr:uncharacterized protein BN574_01751 [Phascolarctobacterium sp. CAG:266]
MRKNLSYKILAALMAAGSFGLYAATPAAAAVELTNGQLRANGNAIVIKNNELTEPAMDLSNVSQVYGVGYNYSASYKDDADGGNVEINDSTFDRIYGGYTDGSNDTATANNNTVTLNGSNIDYVYGGHSGHRSANVNTVTITGGKYGVVVGGSSGNNADSNVVSISNAAINRYIIGGLGITTADSNKIEITNSNVNISSSTKGWALTGGYASSGNASENKIIITDSTISGNVYGGYIDAASTQIANNNSITITGSSSNIANANLYGYATYSGNAKVSNNTLTLNGWSGNTQSVQNFNVINFENVNWDSGGTVLNITNNTEEKALANTNINLNDLNFSGGAELNAGESMTIISNNNSGKNLGIGTGKVDALSNFTAGVAIEGTGTAEVASDSNSVKYTLTEVKHLDQIDLVAENRAVAAAFVNQGTDLISDSLDTISRDSNYGVKTFAAVHGNRSKYDVNSDIKINGWSTIVGVGNADKFDNGSEFSWGVFYENGSGNYRTYNEFNNEFFRGDGSLVYNGGGIAARYENKNGVYTEGSLRAGMLKSDMDNALRDGAGNFYGYESESAYYGAHIGIGKIISLSESSDLDIYGKFFHTYTEGDSFKVANDEFEFDSINSDRLRVGARITGNKENKFSTYYGLAYEYEFNGDADMTAQGLKAPTQSLQGSSVMAEVGFNYQPTPTSPWSFDLNMRGYTGERQGGSFNVQAMYTF